MRDELLLGGEAAQIGTILADHDFDRLDPDGVDRHQVHSADPVGLAASTGSGKLLSTIGHAHVDALLPTNLRLTEKRFAVPINLNVAMSKDDITRIAKGMADSFAAKNLKTQRPLAGAYAPMINGP